VEATLTLTNQKNIVDIKNKKKSERKFRKNRQISKVKLMDFNQKKI